MFSLSKITFNLFSPDQNSPYEINHLSKPNCKLNLIHFKWMSLNERLMLIKFRAATQKQLMDNEWIFIVRINNKMTAKTLRSGLWVLLIVGALLTGVAADDSRLLAYTTTPTRTNNVNTYCAGMNRNTIISSADVSTANSYMAQIAASTSISGNSLISAVINGNMASAQSQALAQTPVMLGLFMFIFSIGLILMQFIWPCLCCCCCCPSCCPSKCCQKPEEEQYTKCELYWPSITLIIALLLVIGSSAYGFTKAGMVADNVNSMACSLSILTDDMLNGNVTQDGTSFFVGLNQLVTQMGNINGNMTTINNSLTDLASNPGTNMTTILNSATNALNSIDLISNGTSNTPLTLTYATPLNSGAPTSTISSNFPTVLGTMTGGGIVQGLYDSVNTVKATLSTIGSNAASFQSASSGFSGGIATAQSSISGFSTTIAQGDSTIGTFMGTATSPSSMITIAIQGIYGGIIGFSVLALIGVLLMTCCGKVGCRHLMYFSCVFIFVISLLAFVMSSLFSVVVSLLYFSCDFLNFSLSSSANFNANFGTYLTGSTGTYVTTCLPSSTGDLASAIGGASLSAISQLGTAFNGISSFNSTAATSGMTSALTLIGTTIAQYGLAQILDITDSASISILNNMASPSAFSTCQSANTLFAADSWVPSVNQNPVSISCTASTGSATDTQCSTAGIFAAGTSGCAGCMDTMKVLFTQTVGTYLASRYTHSGCASFNLSMSNIWNNFYSVKKNVIGVATSGATSSNPGVYSRFLTAQTNVGTLMTYITTNITNLFAATNTAVAALVSITDPTFGLVAGLNCKLFGQDFVRIEQSICVNVFNTMYLSRLILGIVGYAFLFAMCCIVCSGVRHFKHEERKGKIQDAFPSNSFPDDTLQSFKAKRY